MASFQNEELSAELVSGKLVIAWHAAPTLAGVRQAAGLLDDYPADAGPIDYLGVIEAGDEFPADDARKALANLLHEHDFRRVALVFPQKGFKASIVRSIVSMMGLASRKASHQKVFESLAPAIGWLVEGRDVGAAVEFDACARRLCRIES